MARKQLNFNIGVLGHVDSGKTSLCRALSAVASTASFDKHPQSKERGITLDLGFSSFSLALEKERKEEFGGVEAIQYTLVDCPGHASLIRTIIGGAQIIDLMFLVVDVMKGIQTQTAECLVIGEILCRKMIIVLNKIDMISKDKRSVAIEKMKKRIQRTLESTVFKDAPVIAVSVCPNDDESLSDGMADLTSLLKKETYLPRRKTADNFIFAVDHCFAIRGQGTIMTGTVLAGHATLNDSVEIPHLKITRKIKSMQMFKQQEDFIQQGDRAGICVTQFDPKLLERGLICSPGTLQTVFGALVSLKKIPYYKGHLSSKSKFHITMGHETVMGLVTFFSHDSGKTVLAKTFDFLEEYTYEEEVGETNEESTKVYFALLEFEKAVVCQANSIFIGSKLDSDIDANICRLAFHGNIMEGLTDRNYRITILPKLKIYKLKTRQGNVDRCPDEYTVIAKNIFKKETDVNLFTGLEVILSSGHLGFIEGSFGQSGKVKIRVPGGLQGDVFERYKGSAGKKKTTDTEQPLCDSVDVSLVFKKYIFGNKNLMTQ